MSGRLSSWLGFVRDERGTSLIEFGFLAPFLALLTMGVIDLSRGLAERFQLQQAVNASLELVQAKTRVADSSGEVNYDFVKKEAMRAAEVGADQVTVDKWLECDGEDGYAWNKDCPAGTDTARYLRVHIRKDFKGDFYFETIPMTASGALRIQ